MPVLRGGTVNRTEKANVKQVRQHRCVHVGWPGHHRVDHLLLAGHSHVCLHPFIPNYHCFPFRVWRIFGSRSPSRFFVEFGA